MVTVFEAQTSPCQIPDLDPGKSRDLVIEFHVLKCFDDEGWGAEGFVEFCCTSQWLHTCVTLHNLTVVSGFVAHRMLKHQRSHKLSAANGSQV